MMSKRVLDALREQFHEDFGELSERDGYIQRMKATPQQTFSLSVYHRSGHISTTISDAPFFSPCNVSYEPYPQRYIIKIDDT